MKSELIVDVQSDEIAIALTEDDRLMEVSKESRTEATFAVGNIYYGRVKKVMPALNAVFVDVGHEKEAFLHYLDLGSQFLTLEKFTQFAVQDKNRKPLITKTPQQKEVGKQGSIADVCRVGQEILVQVSKEPINTKGPRLTAEISLAGRNIVLIPFGDKVMVSNKIKSEAERRRLKQLVQSIKPERFGVIVRTVAEGKRVAELDAELRLLVKRWDDTVARLQKAKPVSLVAEEIGRTIGVIRDVFSPNFTAIYVNDADTFEEVKSYVSLIAPESEKIVRLYEGEQPIFDHFDITRQMKTGLGRTVGFKNGGYLVMERTEALFSIDVNSGSKKLGTDQEQNAFNCNLLAADEIYHQLRLRDIGGIIIVDFIDMDSAEHRQLLFEHMRTLMKRDRARHNVLQLSKFGLMQITRQRVRPVVEVDVQEVCPTCLGKGKIQPSILFTDTLDEQIELYCQHFGKGLRLYVHPFVYAYASQGFFFTTLKMKWWRQYRIRLIADESLALLDYRFVNKEGKKIEMPKIQEDSTDQKADRKAKLYAVKPIEEKPEVKLPKKDEPEPKTKKAEAKSKKDEKKPKAEPNVKQENQTAKAEDALVPTMEEETLQAASKRSRRRKKKKANASADAAPELTTQPTAPVQEIVSEDSAETNEANEPTPKKSKRSRSKKAKAEMASSEKVASVAETLPEKKAETTAASDTEKTPKKPAKSRRKTAKTAEKAPEAAVVTAEVVAELKPVVIAEPKASEEVSAEPAKAKKAPRKTKAKAKAEQPTKQETAPAETPAAEAPKAEKKKRAPKAKKQQSAEAAEPASTEEAKPKAKRTRKKATPKADKTAETQA